MARWLPLLMASCIGAEGIGFPAEGGLYFVLTMGESGEQLRDVEGPYLSSEGIVVVRRGPASRVRTLLLHIGDDGLERVHPRYNKAARLETKVTAADAELQDCGPEGRSLDEAKLEVPLETLALEDGTSLTQVFALDFERGHATETEHPNDLMVELPVHPCGSGLGIRFAPFAASARIFGETSTRTRTLDNIGGLSALDEDHLVVFAHEGVALVRRGGVVNEARDVFRIEDHFERTESGRWLVLHGEVAARDWPRGPAFAFLALTKSETTQSGAFDMGAGWVRLRLSPEGLWSLDQKLVREVERLDDRLSLRHVFVEPTERYFVTGRNLVLTATSATARPVEKLRPGFAARATYPLNEVASPHLVLLNGSEVFEGDLFELEVAPRTHAVTLNKDASLISAAWLPPPRGTWIVSASDSRLFRRLDRGEWELETYTITDQAAVCASAPSDCGVRSLSHSVGPMVAAPNGDGYIFGSSRCAALFWRRARDPCAAAIPIDGLPIRGDGNGPQVLQTLHERVYLAVGADQLYELELE